MEINFCIIKEDCLTLDHVTTDSYFFSSSFSFWFFSLNFSNLLRSKKQLEDYVLILFLSVICIDIFLGSWIIFEDE